MAAKQNNYVVFDVETGGLSSSKNPITQIALISFDAETLDEVSRYETYVQPYNGLAYEQAALSITGITMSDINGGVPVAQMVKEVAAELVRAKVRSKKPILVGHNVIGFDMGFLQVAFDSAKIDLSKYIEKIQMDTMWLSRMAWPGEEDIANHKLGTCCEKVGAELIDAHRAMNDVEGTLKLFQHFIKGGRGASGNGAVSKSKYRQKFEF